MSEKKQIKAKMLKEPEPMKILSDEEVIEIVLKYSARYGKLKTFQMMDDEAFRENWIKFKEADLPPSNRTFSSINHPQITANMFYIVETRECKRLLREFSERFDEIKERLFAKKSIREKEYMGRDVVRRESR